MKLKKQISTKRLEAFSDGLFAVAITIMVLKMEVPKGYHLIDLDQSLSLLGTYIGSFIFIGIFWLNHHHLFQMATKVNVKILRANLNLLFWISLLPFASNWYDESTLEKAPVIMYASILFMCNLSYKLLTHLVCKNEGKRSMVAKIFKKDIKWIVIITINFLAVVIAFKSTDWSMILLLLLYIIWLIPNKRISKIY